MYDRYSPEEKQSPTRGEVRARPPNFSTEEDSAEKETVSRTRIGSESDRKIKVTVYLIKKRGGVVKKGKRKA